MIQVSRRMRQEALRLVACSRVFEPTLTGGFGTFGNPKSTNDFIALVRREYSSYVFSALGSNVLS